MDQVEIRFKSYISQFGLSCYKSCENNTQIPLNLLMQYSASIHKYLCWSWDSWLGILYKRQCLVIFGFYMSSCSQQVYQTCSDFNCRLMLRDMNWSLLFLVLLEIYVLVRVAMPLGILMDMRTHLQLGQVTLQ